MSDPAIALSARRWLISHMALKAFIAALSCPHMTLLEVPKLCGLFI